MKREKQSGSGALMPIIGFGLFAGAAYLLYDYFTKNPQENSCTNPDGVEGQTECVDDVNKKCQDGNWVNGGNACSGIHLKGQPCSVPGSGYCGNDGKYYLCENGGYAYSDGTPCSMENCNALGCVSTDWKCGGQVAGDLSSDFYYDKKCNPEEARCNFMQVTHDSEVCQQQVPGSMVIRVNNTATNIAGLIIPVDLYVRGSCSFGWFGTAQEVDHADIVIAVKDSKANPIGDCDVMLEALSIKNGGFVHPDDTTNGFIDCNVYYTTANVSGTALAKWVWTWEGELSDSKTLEFRVTASKNGVSAQQNFKLTYHSSAVLAGWTCDGIRYGSNCRQV